MSDNGHPAPAPPMPQTHRQVVSGEIKRLDPAQFGKKAELTERLKSILKDVPVLHERLTKATKEFEEITSRARSIVEEWERLNAESKESGR